MAGEISASGTKILYAPETTVGEMPETGWKEKPTGAVMNIADFVTKIGGISAKRSRLPCTPISETKMEQSIPGLMEQSDNATFTSNINDLSRSVWKTIVEEYTALTGGKSIWWQVVLPEATQGYFFRGIPLDMELPDLEANTVVQGDVQVTVQKLTGWATKILS